MKSVFILILGMIVFGAWMLMHGYAYSALKDGTWEPYAAFGVFTISAILMFILTFTGNSK